MARKEEETALKDEFTFANPIRTVGKILLLCTIGAVVATSLLWLGGEYDEKTDKNPKEEISEQKPDWSEWAKQQNKEAVYAPGSDPAPTPDI